MPKIFVSYRRDDSGYPAELIHRELVSRFGAQSIFFDIDTIPLGVDFHEHVSDAVAQCDVLLAIIGDQWLDARNQHGERRLEFSNDLVRIEIEAALARNIRVIPVLVGKASMPAAQDLPESLRGLARRNATELRSGKDFGVHLERLVRGIERDLVVDKRHVRLPKQNSDDYAPSMNEVAIEELRKPSVEDTPQTPSLLVAPFDASEAKAAQRAWAAHLGSKVIETNSIGMSLVLIPPGEFLMGSPKIEANGRDGQDRRGPIQTTIPQPFFMGVYEVTQAEWRAMMKDSENNSEPSFHSSTGDGKDKVLDLDTSRCPVEMISWLDAVEFCNLLSRREGLAEFYDLRLTKRRADGSIEDAGVDVPDPSRKGYRLPTEAEWEYACRAGTTTVFHFGDALNGRAANVDGRKPLGTKRKGPFLGRPTTVGSYNDYANNFGLFDMHGNVWEWCEDWDDESFQMNVWATKPYPVNIATAAYRNLRGGSWDNNADFAGSAEDFQWNPNGRLDVIGFRIVRSA